MFKNRKMVFQIGLVITAGLILIFIYTDGVPEATNSDVKMFGVERMIEALNKKPDASPAELLDTVKSAVDEFVGDAEQFDDLTMLCIRYLG